MLAGAKACDEVTRLRDTKKNPAAMMALMWHHATAGRARRISSSSLQGPLLLFSRYLQQLIMESLGKRLDLDGKRVDQGIAVYGNKGRPTSMPTSSSSATARRTSSSRSSACWRRAASTGRSSPA
jgi:glucose-6-phosphate isomerase